MLKSLPLAYLSNYLCVLGLLFSTLISFWRLEHFTRYLKKKTQAQISPFYKFPVSLQLTNIQPNSKQNPNLIFKKYEHLTLGLELRLVLWCLMPLSTIFQLYHGSVSLVKETGIPGENYRPVASHWQTLSHNVASSTPLLEWDSNSQLHWW